jgi:hypothetical protein
MRAFVFVSALFVVGVFTWSAGYSRGWRDGFKR